MSSLPYYALAPGVAKQPEFASRLNAALERLHIQPELRQAWIAQAADVSESQALGYLRGEFLPPEMRLLSMAAALGVNAVWLVQGAGAMTATAAEAEHQPFRPADPMVLRWVPANQARAAHGIELGAKAVAWDDYQDAVDRLQVSETRRLRAEAAVVKRALPTDAPPNDPRVWAARMHELIDLALKADTERNDAVAIDSIENAFAFLEAWKRRLT